MKARVIINDVISDGEYSKSMLLRLSRMGALITAYPKSGTDGEPIDMESDSGYEFIKNYNGK